MMARGHRPQRKNRARVMLLRPVRPSKQAEIWYRGKLLGLVHHARALLDAELAKVKPHWLAAVGDSVAADDDKNPEAPPPDPGLRAEAEAAVSRASNSLPKLGEWAAKTAAEAAAKNAGAVEVSLTSAIQAKLGVDVGPVLHAYGPLSQPMREAIVANVELIKTIPTEYLGKVRETLETAWQEGIGWEQAGKMLEVDFQTAESRARLIAEDQTAKMAGSFNRECQQRIGIEKYKWNCSRKNTRPEHLAMESKQTPYGVGIYRWDQPGPLAGTIDGAPCHPGQDIRCRCAALSVVELDDLNTNFWDQPEHPQEVAA